MFPSDEIPATIRILDETLHMEPQNLVGTIVGNYRLVTELGSGGMGTVYYAEHQVIGRRAAIKVLRPEVSRDANVVSRFLTEARAANDIRHPNVVEITDIGRHDDLYYIIMSFLEGETLGERIERSAPMEEQTMLRIARQVMSALGGAHDRGIVHRDLKPENVFLTNHPDYPDYVKVLDFGIAKLIGQNQKVSHQTAAGIILGTPEYMSPEQCRGVDVDHRSDIYSLGVVIYEMVTGDVPFPGEAIGEVLIAHVTQAPVPVYEKNSELSSRTSDAIMQALEKDPEKRFASMREFRAAFEDVPKAAARSTRSIKATPAADPLEAEEEDQEQETFDPLLHEEQEKREAREAKFVVNKLSDIIRDRIAKDRLVLPSMPQVAMQCMQMLNNPRETFKSVAGVVAKDPLLASRILKLANSAAFPGLIPATTVDQAISRMGTDGLKSALVEFSMHQAFSSRDERIRAAFKGIFEHSLAVALVAKELAVAVGGNTPNPNTAYLGGLLHDVGKPVVATMLLEAERVLVSDGSIPWMNDAVWKRVVRESHRSVGYVLARRWNLPDEISKAIELGTEYDRANPRCCANVVRLANCVVKKNGLYMGEIDQEELDKAIEIGRQLLRLTIEQIDGSTKNLYNKVGTMLHTKEVQKQPTRSRRRAQ